MRGRFYLISANSGFAAGFVAFGGSGGRVWVYYLVGVGGEGAEGLGGGGFGRAGVSGWDRTSRGFGGIGEGDCSFGRSLARSFARSRCWLVRSFVCSAAAWDTVEELSAAVSHSKASGPEDPLEKFCEEDPSADECRVYED